MTAGLVQPRTPADRHRLPLACHDRERPVRLTSGSGQTLRDRVRVGGGKPPTSGEWPTLTLCPTQVPQPPNIVTWPSSRRVGRRGDHAIAG